MKGITLREKIRLKARRTCAQLTRRWINNFGQSILELAIFGSIVLMVLGFLIQYGLDANYQQNLQMQTFNKAVGLARSAANTYLNVNLVAVRDLAVPSPQEHVHMAETTPQVAQAQLAWTNNLFAHTKDVRPQDLPRITYLINGVKKEYTIAGWGNIDDLNLASDQEVNIKEYDIAVGSNGELIIDNYNIDGSLGSDGIYWYWIKKKWEELREGDHADVDGDGKEETIVKEVEKDGKTYWKCILCYTKYYTQRQCCRAMLSPPYDIDGDGDIDWNCPSCSFDQKTEKVIVPQYYIDYQLGQIDTTRSEAETQQGLQMYDYSKGVKIEDTSLEKWEDSQKIKTKAKATVKETIKRKVIKGPNDEEETIESEIERKSDDTWTTPHP